jgi:hypothetical protein
MWFKLNLNGGGTSSRIPIGDGASGCDREIERDIDFPGHLRRAHGARLMSWHPAQAEWRPFAPTPRLQVRFSLRCATYDRVGGGGREHGREGRPRHRDSGGAAEGGAEGVRHLRGGATMWVGGGLHAKCSHSFSSIGSSQTTCTPTFNSTWKRPNLTRHRITTDTPTSVEAPV